MKNKKNILITGGAGFIGSHLCERLLSEGNKVICVDSFFSGKKENIVSFLQDKNFTLIKHDIICPLKKKFRKIDEIYNLACPASPVQYQFDPILTLKTAVLGTLNMLDLARKYNSIFIQASTSEVYGDPLEHPQKETYFGNVDPIGKRSCYDEGKRAAESLCKDYREQYGVDARIVRLFNIYGPKMMFNDGRVVSNFILQSILNEDISIHGDGEQSRSFMYIDDLIDGFLKLMSLDKEKAGLGPFNFGNPDEKKILELAVEIKKILASSSKVIFLDYQNIPERIGDPQRRCPDVSRIKSLIDWHPRIDLKEGLEKTINDFKNRLENKTKILIFSPSFFPFEGPAEKILKNIAGRLTAYEFDMITARVDKKLDKFERIDNINVHRIGTGSRFDKYLLVFLAPFFALKLNKKRNYQLAWGIMASYGSLAANIFSFISRCSVLVSVFEGAISERKLNKKYLLPFYKIIFRRSHQLQLIGKLDQVRQAWLEDDKKIQFIDLEKGYDLAAKKTKEKFQYLEILSSRL